MRIIKNVNSENSYHKLYECPGEILCQECFLWENNKGYCKGCNSEYQQRCLKRICDYNCSRCSGGKFTYMPGYCGRMPKSRYKNLKMLFSSRIPEYMASPLNIKCRLIPIIYPQIRNHRIPDEFPQIDAWAVPISKILNKKGKLRSNDMNDIKKYLNLPPDRKLILSTCAPDDYQEMLWKNDNKIDYKKLNIDYWFPAHFSIYDNDSKLYQFTSALKQQLNAVHVKSQFVWFRIGENIDKKFLKSIKNAPSVLISANQMYSKKNQENLHKDVVTAHKWFPPKTAFFILGSEKHIPNLGNRPRFKLDSNWLMCALKRKNIDRKKDDSSQKNLLTKNLREVLRNVHPSII